jgi:hypothetical protein
LESHLARAGEKVLLQELPAALVSPHAGYDWSGDCAGHAYATLRGPAGSKVRRVVILAPSHYAYLDGASVLPVSAYETPLGRVPVDREAVERLLREPGFRTVEEAHAQEHADEIQLPFLQHVLPGPWKLVDVVVQGVGPERWEDFGRSLLPLVDAATLVVASSDFTHFGHRFGYFPFREEIPENLRRLDLEGADRVLAVDPEGWAEYKEATGITACGFEPIGILLHLLRLVTRERRELARGFRGHLLDYYRSGDLNGDFSSSVSYVAILFEPIRRPEEREGSRDTEEEEEAGSERLGPAERSFLLKLARETLELYLREGRTPKVEIPEGLRRDLLTQPRGVFVTLRKGDRLRGCIGTIVGQEPLVEGVVRQAVQSAVSDPRFPPVTPEELPGIRIEISVLTPLREVSGPGEIVLGRDGILLERGGHRAVFLPQVAPEQGWDLETTLTQLALKAGLGPEDWKDPQTRFSVFQAEVFEEPEAQG